MRELRPGVWHWQAPHPDWDEEAWWPELVSSCAIELGDDVLLFDPLSVPDELRDRATAVVLTAPYHERDARRLGLPVHTRRPRIQSSQPPYVVRAYRRRGRSPGRRPHRRSGRHR